VRLLAGELSAQSGSLQINGLSWADKPQAYRSQVFWVDPRTQAFDAMTPPAYWDGDRQQCPAFDGALLLGLAEAFALAPHLPKSLTMLSTGTKRKVFLAAAFASGAAVTLLDEPFAALDKTSIDWVLEVLQEAGIKVEIASIQGGEPPVDGVNLDDPINARFWNDPVFREAIRATARLRDVDASRHSAIFFAGGHGAMWDFPDDPAGSGRVLGHSPGRLKRRPRLRRAVLRPSERLQRIEDDR